MVGPISLTNFGNMCEMYKGINLMRQTNMNRNLDSSTTRQNVLTKKCKRKNVKSSPATRADSCEEAWAFERNECESRRPTSPEETLPF